MRTVTIVLLKVATLCVLLLVFTAGAEAGGRRFLLRRTAHEARPPHTAHRGPIDPRALYPHYSYPQYDGGIHARALQNIGVPTGDIGLRGNGFMLNPW